MYLSQNMFVLDYYKVLSLNSKCMNKAWSYIPIIQHGHTYLSSCMVIYTCHPAWSYIPVILHGHPSTWRWRQKDRSLWLFSTTEPDQGQVELPKSLTFPSKQSNSCQQLFLSHYLLTSARAGSHWKSTSSTYRLIDSAHYLSKKSYKSFVPESSQFSLNIMFARLIHMGACVSVQSFILLNNIPLYVHATF